MTSHIQLVENGKLIGLDGRDWSPSPINEWPGLAFETHPHMCKGEVADRYNPHALIFVRQGSFGRSRIRSGSRTYDLNLAPGQVDIFEAHFQMDRGYWDCTPGDLLAIELDTMTIRAFLGEEASKFRLSTRLATRDPVVACLLECIRYEIEGGCQSGKLFAEGITAALLARFGLTTSHPKNSSHRLTASQLRVVTEYVEAHIGTDLAVSDLSALLTLSPQHFTRLFKATTLQTPHQFVLHRRVEAAKKLLLTRKTIAQTAYELGFSSQAHLTTTFRAQTGCTPAQYRLP